MLCSLGDGSLIAPTAAGRTTTAKSAATRSKNGRPDCGLLEFVFMGSEYFKWHQSAFVQNMQSLSWDKSVTLLCDKSTSNQAPAEHSAPRKSTRTMLTAARSRSSRNPPPARG